MGPFANPLVVHIGDVSYGIYLLHMLVLNAVERVLPGQGALVRFALAFPITVAAATVTRRWFEGPILRFRSSRVAAPVAASVQAADQISC